MRDNPLIFELSVPGRVGHSLSECDVPSKCIEDLIPDEYLRKDLPKLPEVSEVDAVRHFIGLSRLNHGVDNGFYPLGSCTMKYNPKINEDVAALEGFSSVHPYQPEETVQGCLELLYKTGEFLSEITGMAKMSLQPAAGAHGELTGLMIIKAYHAYKGETGRKKIIVPDSAHGTNPASAAFAGFEVIQIKSNEKGGVDLEDLKSVMGNDVAGLMLTNPNTLGLFDEHIKEIADIVHNAGGLLYYDGANANAILGIARPGDMGFDIVHLNLHKTFSTPHGGGGPGAGPIGVVEKLVPFLPYPIVELKDGKYYLNYDLPLSIGRVKSFYGNFSVIVKTYAYILSMGSEGLRKVSENAVLNANYVMNKLKEYYELPFDQKCMHEFVLSAQKQKEAGVSAIDIAKRLLDYGIHPPTVYFPLIVKEALMIEPTETESKETLDEFIDIMISIAKEAESNPDTIKSAPHNTPVTRLDEVKAARNLILRYDFRL
ncbi:MAG TPA: aminomethyl-transferring glycine dehydrogenase subunit GcvPB [Clostridiaceae bacterium]|nr:aminomethyl-transferring glycine dehydrogenase subunit GcvPB [Clostridiaceae bacterium]